ncbi:unnamed protein product, partial [Timema podura]|nr:unnamed protein product [Timema podura]
MFPNGLTQLTSIGMEQHFELGEFFRERYRNILPIKYNLNDIYVRSSDVDRCLQSATFNLQKFYPPIRKGNSEEITFQAVPIHTAPFQKDKYLGVIPNCNKFYIDLYKLNSTEPLQCMAEKTRAIKEYVSRECDIGQFSSIVYDTLFIEKYVTRRNSSLHLLIWKLSTGASGFSRAF